MTLVYLVLMEATEIHIEYMFVGFPLTGHNFSKPENSNLYFFKLTSGATVDG